MLLVRRLVPLIALLAVFPVQAQPAYRPSFPILGVCYELHIGTWKPKVDLKADSIYLSPPRRIQFDTLWSLGATGFRQIRPAPGTSERRGISGGWTPADSGRTRLTWTNGLMGITMIVRPSARADSIAGVARSFWDNGHPVQEAAVYLQPFKCAG
jgi:hypothetical protein